MFWLIATPPTRRVSRKPLAKVLLMMEQDSGYHAGVMLGVSSYARLTKRWMLVLVSPGYADPLTWIDQYRPDGIILNVLHPEWVTALRSRRIPAVNIGHQVSCDLPRVGVDDHAAGALAARHMLDRGIRHFGFFGSDIPFSNDRARGFAETLAQAGIGCAVCDAYRGDATELVQWRTKWVASLEQPAGVLACSDFFAMALGESCHNAGARVPEDVAIVGVDNDELLCEMTSPPLSSVVVPTMQIGYRAAQLLDRLMRGGKPPRRPLLLKPSGLVTRHSSDVLAVADRDLAAAMRFIRENAHRPIGVRDLLEEVPVCRRRLERRFRDVLGRTPSEEIRRGHIERAKDLLARTGLKTDEVASRSGFTTASDLSKAFRRATGLTPSAYRRQFRLAE